MKKWVGPLFGVIVLVAVAGVSLFQYTEARKALNQTEEEALRAEQAAEESAPTETGLSKSLLSQMEEVTGYDDNRVRTDKSAAEAFFRSVFDWSGYEEYVENRNYALESGIAEDSQFLTTFFPDAVQEAEDGSFVSSFQDGGYELNMSYEGMPDLYVTAISDDVYSYLAVVQTSTETEYETSDGTEKAADTAECVLLFDMDADGVMSNLSGYVLGYE